MAPKLGPGERLEASYERPFSVDRHRFAPELSGGAVLNELAEEGGQQFFKDLGASRGVLESSPGEQGCGLAEPELIADSDDGLIQGLEEFAGGTAGKKSMEVLQLLPGLRAPVRGEKLKELVRRAIENLDALGPVSQAGSKKSQGG